ncbi:MAG: D-glycero-beta-D-manno-heptose-7-phosphate kinase [Alphaproteobacteria bacterium]|jgi:D-beta-D-heptose 7-phosphate kinase/D-beta-D-heptose 1-phosphate adenosyltransferase|nr:D-glycero-beta-D-manno-heptose-7-phosphate kinase [Alphaproteobacteria bacterium]
MTDPDALSVIIAGMAGTRVLCLGDAMLDRYVYGTVERVSPEAPIPVLRMTGEAAMPGGAGNVAANLVGLGVGTDFAAVIGDDEAGRHLADLAGQSIGPVAALIVEPGRPTTLKMRYVAGAQQLLRADRETAEPIADATAARLCAAIEAVLPGCRAVVLSDYAKGVLRDDVIARTIAAARARGLPVVVDPKGRDFARYRGASVLTPNRKELAEASGRPVDGDAEVTEAARALLAATGVPAMVVTRGERGMSVVPAEGEPVHLHGEAREVFDVSGAGDTVVATVSAALAAGASLTQAARLANLAGGIVVGKVGTAVIHAEELAAALRHERWARGEAKVLEHGPALERIGRWRTEGRRIGFTNGCFDLLHPGHLSLLNQARGVCDRLVVGLNSDASVRRLKGPDRPIQDETARAAVLASLEAVDLVVLFEEDTPLRLIEAVRPDLLVKGADYTVETVVGAEIVQSYGGRVHLATLAPGHSTTATISRMAK